jgi:hypothetical protein
MSILARAELACTQGIRYKLGAGGYKPLDPWPARKTLRVPKGKLLPVLARWCDCSGFVAWLVGKSRATTIVPGMWGISTDSIYRDAMSRGRTFMRIGSPVAGCFAVYPDHLGHQGHVALVKDPAKRIIIDCASSRGGVTEHVDDKAHFFTRSDAIFCIYIGG